MLPVRGRRPRRVCRCRHDSDQRAIDPRCPGGFGIEAELRQHPCLRAYTHPNCRSGIALLGFGVVGYVFKKISIPLAPFRLALVLGNRAEDAFRLSMIGSGGDMKVFWSNGLVGSITLAIVLLFWPLIDKAFGSVGRLWRPVKA